LIKAPLPLTDTKARSAKPKERPYKLFDGDGLFLIETPSGGNRNKDQILSWLPATYKECGRVIQEAARSDNWTDIGVIAEASF
jgi:hypothetical protein